MLWLTNKFRGSTLEPNKMSLIFRVAFANLCPSGDPFSWCKIFFFCFVLCYTFWNIFPLSLEVGIFFEFILFGELLIISLKFQYECSYTFTLCLDYLFLEENSLHYKFEAIAKRIMLCWVKKNSRLMGCCKNYSHTSAQSLHKCNRFKYPIVGSIQTYMSLFFSLIVSIMQR